MRGALPLFWEDREYGNKEQGKELFEKLDHLEADSITELEWFWLFLEL